MAAPGEPDTDDDPAAEPSGASPRAKLIAVLGVAVLLLAAWRLGAFEALKDPAAVKALLVDLGPWGYLAFVATYAALQPFGVPGTVFVFAAPLIWPWPIAFGLSMAGTMAASVIGFSFARFIARDWVARRIPKRFKKYDAALERNAFWTVALLRFLLWMPQVLHFFLGISKVRFWTHFWGSIVGYFIPLLLVSFFGEKLFDLMKDAPAEVWVGVGVAVAAVALGAWWMRRCKKTRATATSAA